MIFLKRIFKLLVIDMAIFYILILDENFNFIYFLILFFFLLFNLF